MKLPEKPNNSDSDLAAEAQRIHTEAYLNSNLITPTEVGPDGLYIDEYSSRAEPIVVKFGDKATAIRLIHADKKGGGILSLPTAKYFSIEPKAVRDVAGVTRLSDIRAKDVVELSGLGSIKSDQSLEPVEVFDATRQAYATALRHSLDQGHKLWLMNIDQKLKDYLDLILGEDQIVQIGDEMQYMGPETLPAAANPQDIVMSILSKKEGRFSDVNKEDIAKALDGVNEKFLSSKLKKLLHENEIATTPNSKLSKAWNNRMAIIYGGIIGYSALRFVPVAFVEQFNGSVPLYAGIDVVTAVTQVASMEVMFKSKTRTKRALGAVGTAASFVAPYVYFYANGDAYPWYVNSVAGGFVALSAYLETSKSLSDRKLKHGLEHTTASEN